MHIGDDKECHAECANSIGRRGVPSIDSQQTQWASLCGRRALMWIVKLALDRPYTFIVASILILFLGLSSIVTMPADIFPNIDIPIITVVYDYRGLPAEELEQRITTFNEFITSTVNDVKADDSQTIRGYAVLMIYFQPQVHIYSS